jgi:hypothetical protein
MIYAKAGAGEHTYVATDTYRCNITKVVFCSKILMAFQGKKIALLAGQILLVYLILNYFKGKRGKHRIRMRISGFISPD